jgi:hypothetical protein
MPKPREVTPRENVDVIDRAVAAQERSPFRIDHPCDLGRWIRIAESAAAGKVWTMSPNELGLMMRMDETAEFKL